MFNKDNNRGFAPRQMIKGNWKCGDCGAEITELPFEPAADRPIYCRDCWSKKRPPRQNRYSATAKKQSANHGLFFYFSQKTSL